MRAPRGPDFPPLLAAILIGVAIITGAFDSPKIATPPGARAFIGPRVVSVDPVSTTEWSQATLADSGQCYWVRDRAAAYLRPAGQANRHKYSSALEPTTTSVQMCEGVEPDAAVRAYP
jgi:hypothetical protein